MSNIATDQMLYTEQDLESSMDKIETINFHEEKEVNGIKFWFGPFDFSSHLRLSNISVGFPLNPLCLDLGAA